MHTPDHHQSIPWPDAEAVIRLLRRLPDHEDPVLAGLMAGPGDLVVGRAPGRLDVMGGIADYSGSLVLQMPIAQATFAALGRREDRQLRIASLGSREHRAADFTMALDHLAPEGRPLSYAAAQSLFRQDPDRHWAAYVAGVFLVLMREKGVRFPHGADILIDSQVPEAKGVSSSAALEVAAMQAVATAYGVDLAPREMAILCQKVENLVVGAPCGVMDQMTAVCGEADRLMALLCQPAELRGQVSIPTELAIWGIDSGIRHVVSGSDYTSVRVGAFMGYRIIADLAGLDVDTGQDPLRVQDPTWRGYLANIPPSLFQQHYAHSLPEKMTGAVFLERYGGTTDGVTRIEPQRTYGVRIPTAHPVYEHFRVRTFAELLRKPITEETLVQLGELMYQSHVSYSACGLGSEGTDRLVALVREAGPQADLFGAKITGGGSGGTVAVLGRNSPRAEEAVAAIVAEYAAQRGTAPFVFRGSSAGSAALGPLRLAR